MQSPKSTATIVNPNIVLQNGVNATVIPLMSRQRLLRRRQSTRGRSLSHPMKTLPKVLVSPTADSRKQAVSMSMPCVKKGKRHENGTQYKKDCLIKARKSPFQLLHQPGTQRGHKILAFQRCCSTQSVEIQDL